MPQLGGQCCAQCADIYIVDDTGQIKYRRYSGFDSAQNWITGCSYCGRDDNGNFMGLLTGRSNALVGILANPQTLPMWIVRAWDENGEKTWDWSNAPFGLQVDIVAVNGSVSSTRDAMRPQSAMMDKSGTTVVAGQVPVGVNFVAVPPWQGFTTDDRMYGIDSEGNQLWDFRVMEQLGIPYSLGVDFGTSIVSPPGTPPYDPKMQAARFFWVFYGTVNVVAVGDKKSIWTAVWNGGLGYRSAPYTDADGANTSRPPEYIIGGTFNWSLFWQVDNETGDIDWHMDWTSDLQTFAIRGNQTRFSNLPTFMGPVGGAFRQTPRFPVMTIGPADDVWACFRGPNWGSQEGIGLWHYYKDKPNLWPPGGRNPYDYLVFVTLMPIVSFTNKVPDWNTNQVILNRIAHPTWIGVSPDGTKVAVCGCFMLGEDPQGFTNNTYTHTPNYPAGGFADSYPTVQVPTVDYGAWIEVFDTSTLAKISEFRVGSPPNGNTNPNGYAPTVIYMGNHTLAIGAEIWSIDPPGPGVQGNYSKYRKFQQGELFGCVQDDDYSAWCGQRYCPNNLLSQTGKVNPAP
jgi:hypothetical protein